MTPLQLNMLMHYYTTPAPYPRIGDVFDEAIGLLLCGELIEPSGKGTACYEVTGRGKALIEHILNLPLPEKKWVMP